LDPERTIQGIQCGLLVALLQFRISKIKLHQGIWRIDILQLFQQGDRFHSAGTIGLREKQHCLEDSALKIQRTSCEHLFQQFFGFRGILVSHRKFREHAPRC
jgi:hypothetical protein